MVGCLRGDASQSDPNLERRQVRNAASILPPETPIPNQLSLHALWKHGGPTMTSLKGTAKS